MTPEPVGFFTDSAKSLIRPGNFQDDLPRIADCDWIIEAVAENLEIKRRLWTMVAGLRRRGTILSTNTSAISQFVDKDDILIFWALEYLWRVYGRHDRADEFDKMAIARAKEAKGNDEDRPDLDVSTAPISTSSPGAYWQDPFQMGTPG